MVQFSVAELAKRVGGSVVGDGAVQIQGPADISAAKPGQISFVSNSKYFRFLESTQASAVIVADKSDCPRKDLTLIRVANPNAAFSKVVEIFAPVVLSLPKGISEKAFVAPSAKLGKEVCIAPFAVISDQTEIGEGTQIHSGVFVGQGARIGKNCVLFANVSVQERVQVGDRVVLHPGTVLGADGFGYDFVNGKWSKVPQCGTVVIEDDVEIGANCAVDRARFGETRIGRGSKLDNLVHVGHNVQVGHDSLLIAQVGISGSAKLGHHVIVAGQAGIGGHVSIGDGARVAGQSGIADDVPPGEEYGGVPGMPFLEWVRSNARLKKMGEYVKKLNELSSRLAALEEKLKKKSS